MAITLGITGILRAAAFWVSNQGGNNGRKLYFYFYILLITISIVIGKGPTILSGTPFLVYYTSATRLDPMAWLIAEFAAANTASMVLFVGNPTNMVICEGFQVNNVAFTTHTILPFIACSLACYAALSFQFRNVEHIPRTFAISGRLNPREALLDPVSAIFGTILLLTCLILVIVLSFFHIDVWEIALPFAVTKVIFDLCWDHYRFTHGQLDSLEPTTELSDEDRLFTQLKRALSMPGDIESILASKRVSNSRYACGSELEEIVEDLILNIFRNSPFYHSEEQVQVASGSFPHILHCSTEITVWSHSICLFSIHSHRGTLSPGLDRYFCHVVSQGHPPPSYTDYMTDRCPRCHLVQCCGYEHWCHHSSHKGGPCCTRFSC